MNKGPSAEARLKQMRSNKHFGEGIEVAVVEEGEVAISPGELLYEGPGFFEICGQRLYSQL